MDSVTTLVTSTLSRAGLGGEEARYSFQGAAIAFAVFNPFVLSFLIGVAGGRPWVGTLLAAAIFYALVLYRMKRGREIIVVQQ